MMQQRRRLSDQERITAAVRKAIADSPGITKKGIVAVTELSGTVVHAALHYLAKTNVARFDREKRWYLR